MEENKAKTTAEATEHPVISVGGADALAAASAQEEIARNDAQEALAPTASGGTEDGGTPKNENETKSGSVPPEPTPEEVNRENARRRREEARARELKKAREEAIIEALDGVNPYNGEELTDSASVERFLEMKAQRFSKAKQLPPVGSDEWFRSDRDAFIAAHPEVELEPLLRDPRFGIFAEGKVGSLTLDEIWSGYQRFLGEFDEKAKNLAAQSMANRLASPGMLGSQETAESDYFSAAQVRDMDAREIRANYEKIRKSMAKW